MGDAELLRDYATAGSETAFAELTARHMDLVYSVALRMVGNDAASARDVAQVVFSDLARKATKLPPGVVVGGWLYRHTCFTASKMVRSEKRRQARERQAVEMQALDEDESAWEQLAPVLEEAMGHLEEKSRDAIVLRFFERQPLREVGQALGVTEDTARKRVDHAVDVLRTYLFRRGVTLSTVTLAALLSAKAMSAAPAGLASGVAITAVVSAAAAHTTTTVGLTKALTMTTLQKLAITTVAAAAIGTTIYEARRASRAEQKLQTLQTQAQPASPVQVTNLLKINLPSPATPVKSFDWQQVESPDYRQYIANLRAIGCPEKTIRDIIYADVNDLYRQRFKAALSLTNRYEYWKPKSLAQLQSQIMSQPQELAREKRELLKELLGENPSDRPDSSILEARASAMRELMLDFLTPEKQMAAMEVQQKYGVRMAALDRLDVNGMKTLLAEQDAELLTVLSPEEKFEWDLRSSRTASFMKAKMGEFEPTEQEFREMLRLQKQYDDQYGPPGYAVVRGDRGDAARQAAEAELQRQLKNLLGPDRYKQYQYESRWEFDYLRSIATEHKVPKATAFQVYDIEEAAMTQARSLSPSLPANQRKALLAAIAAEAGDAVVRLLGPVAGPRYVREIRQHGYLRALQQ